uniref:Tripartite motif-containing protein 65-like n=1 Tax=Erpetoichthys calabaricus TaxID=27687 RepID=A0A8C4TIW4_ERPCA
MAAAKPSLFLDRYSCLLCLDVLSEPVSLPCGHNFCMICINDHWDQLDTEEAYRCPQCRMEFPSRLKLHRNALLSNLLEKLGEVMDEDRLFPNYISTDYATCFILTCQKPRASKSSLNFEALSCRVAIQTHKTSKDLKENKWEEGIGDLREKLCWKHQKDLEMICRTDKTCVCLLCAANEHKSHDTATPEEETAARQTQNTKSKKKRRKQNRWGWRRATTMEETAERSQAESSLLSTHDRRAVRGPRSPRHSLEGASKDGDGDKPNISIQEAIIPPVIQWNLKIRNGFIKYSRLLTMDPNTAHRRLSLSDGNTKVTYEETENPHPDHLDRFDFWEQVLCQEALSDTCCYWEVEWSGDWIEIGVAYKEIARKGESQECLLGSNEKSWSMSCSDSVNSACHNKMKTEIRDPCSHRIGVYLDYPAGSLSFYSISDRMVLLHKFNTFFTEPLYPGFYIGANSSVTICLADRTITP